MLLINKYYYYYCKHVERNDLQSVINIIDDLAVNDKLNNCLLTTNNNNNMYPLGHAISACAPNIVKYLLEKGANTNLTHVYTYGAFNNIENCARKKYCFITLAINTLIFKSNNIYGMSCFLTKSKNKQIKYENLKKRTYYIIDLLIKYGAKINIDDGKSSSILCDAIVANELPIIKILMKYDIDVNAIVRKRTTRGFMYTSILDFIITRYIFSDYDVNFIAMFRLLITNNVKIIILQKIQTVTLWNCLLSYIKPILIFYSKIPNVLCDIIINYIFACKHCLLDI